MRLWLLTTGRKEGITLAFERIFVPVGFFSKNLCLNFKIVKR